jgi:hypothetical protein
MEEVGGRDANGMARPCKQVLVFCGDVKHFASNMAQEDGNLGGRDETAFTYGWVAVYHSGAIGGRAEVPHAPDGVKAGLHGAHPVQVGAMPVGECLTIVIVLLFAEAHGR